MTTLKPIYLFDVGPQKETLSISSHEVLHLLQTFCQAITEKIGEGKSIFIYPHRVIRHCWGLELQGDKDKLPILLNITGRFRLPQVNLIPWPARLTIDVTDHIDAYWLVIFIAETLHLKMTTPSVLSTVNGDNTVYTLERKHDEHN